MLLDARNHSCFDLPPLAGVPRAYVVASTPRTGSTLLCRMLWDTSAVGAPKEYLNPTQRRDWSIRRGQRRYRLLRGPLRGVIGRIPLSDDGLGAHLHHVRERRSSGGWFGLKIHAHHHHRLLGDRRSLEAYLGPIHWLRIHRSDRLGQAISWARAIQTGRWAAGERGWLPPIYSRPLIERCLRQIDAGERYWDRFFAARGAVPLRLEYCALAADPCGEVGRVLSWLGVEAPVAAPSMGRQADAISAAWRARYRAG